MRVRCTVRDASDDSIDFDGYRNVSVVSVACARVCVCRGEMDRAYCHVVREVQTLVSSTLCQSKQSG